MSQGDTSRRVGVAFEGDGCDTFEGKGDACDTFDPSDFEREDAAASGRDNAAKQGDSRAAQRGKKRSVTRRAEAERPLLDSSLSEHTPGHATEQRATDDAEALDRCLRWFVLACIAPALEAARPASLRLAWITLTARDVDTIDEAAQSFANGIVDHKRGGVLLVRDRGEKHGHAHYHALALLQSTDRIGDCWAEFAGTDANPPTVKIVEPWRDFCRKPYEKVFSLNLFRMVEYATEPWPAQYGRRSVEDDIFPSGVFVGSVRAVRAMVAGGLAFLIESLAKASPTCRLCLWCNKPLPARCRSDKRRHRPCGQAFSKAKRRAERADPGDPSDGAP